MICGHLKSKKIRRERVIDDTSCVECKCDIKLGNMKVVHSNMRVVFKKEGTMGTIKL